MFAQLEEGKLVRGTAGVREIVTNALLLTVLFDHLFIHAVQEHILLDFFDLLELAGQVLVRSLEFEISLKVHFSALLE